MFKLIVWINIKPSTAIIAETNITIIPKTLSCFTVAITPNIKEIRKKTGNIFQATTVTPIKKNHAMPMIIQARPTTENILPGLLKNTIFLSYVKVKFVCL